MNWSTHWSCPNYNEELILTKKEAVVFPIQMDPNDANTAVVVDWFIPTRRYFAQAKWDLTDRVVHMVEDVDHHGEPDHRHSAIVLDTSKENNTALPGYTATVLFTVHAVDPLDIKEITVTEHTKTTTYPFSDFKEISRDVSLREILSEDVQDESVPRQESDD